MASLIKPKRSLTPTQAAAAARSGFGGTSYQDELPEEPAKVIPSKRRPGESFEEFLKRTGKLDAQGNAIGDNVAPTDALDQAPALDPLAEPAAAQSQPPAAAMLQKTLIKTKKPMKKPAEEDDYLMPTSDEPSF